MKKSVKKTKIVSPPPFEFALEQMVKDAQNSVQDFIDIQFAGLRTELMRDFDNTRHRAAQRLDQLEKELTVK